MPRRPKQGLDYAPWSVDIFDGDTKVDKLLDAQGWVGFSIYFYLCQMAYKFDGYFYRWAYDDSASTARRMGGGIRSGTVEETVKCCLQVGLFNKRLFESSGILTSEGIQRRFLAAIQERRVKSVIKDYWLLSDGESGGLDKCAKNDDLQGANADLQGANADLQGANDPKSKANERKPKQSKKDYCVEPESASTPAIILLPLNDGTEYPVSEDQLKEWTTLYPIVDVMQQLRNMRGWLNSNPSRRKTRKGILRFITNWLSDDQDKGGKWYQKQKSEGQQKPYEYDYGNMEGSL